MDIQIVPYEQEFLSLSWQWLNDKEIKELTNTPAFTKESQLTWFESLKSKNDYLIWGVEVDTIPIGVCGLKKITQDDCEYWGYIGEKSYWGRGIGKIIMQLLEDNAKEIKLQSIWLQVLLENTRAIRLYQNLGYIEEKRTDRLILMRKIL